MAPVIFASTLELAKDLVRFPSVSHESNELISQFVADRLESIGFEIEWHTYVDERGKTKASIVAKRGSGTGGVCYLAHTDVVPADDWSQDFGQPFDPLVRDDRLYGRGACDRKGSLSCAISAASSIELSQQTQPIYFVVTSDEEVGMFGAKRINVESDYFQEMVEHHTVGIVGEPTMLDVIHAHKGVQRFSVRARGRSAHTSTDDGINANYALIPALPELLSLRQESEVNMAYRNHDFNPSTLSWNMTIINEPDAVNVTPSLAQVNLFIRSMPNVNHLPLLNAVESLCQRHRLELEMREAVDPWSVSASSDWIQQMLQIVGQTQSRTVCFATDAGVLQRMRKLLVCGPGDIQQAHRCDEWIAFEQLQRGTSVYSAAFHTWACS